MSAIPTHIQRRFEQRWASRFSLPIAPKLVGTKATASKSRRSPGRKARTKENTAVGTASPIGGNDSSHRSLDVLPR
jgi:hypothetical protein